MLKENWWSNLGTPPPFLKEPPLSTNPLFLSNFFITPLCPNFKNEKHRRPPPSPLILGGGGENYEWIDCFETSFDIYYSFSFFLWNAKVDFRPSDRKLKWKVFLVGNQAFYQLQNAIKPSTFIHFNWSLKKTKNYPNYSTWS